MPSKTSKLLDKIRSDFPTLKFEEGETFMWSPKDSRIIYDLELLDTERGEWSLLHEIGHAKLDHKTFLTDFELVKMECAAWEEAKLLADTYSIEIDDNHVQDCLDSYRDWLHKRSMCPDCGHINTQNRPGSYSCYNCGCQWTVSSSQLCIERRRDVSLT